PLKYSPIYQPDGHKSEEIIKEKIKKAFDDGDSRFFEFTHLNGLGKYFNAEVSFNKVVLKENTFLQAIVRDITERKKTEQELLKAKDKAEESDRLKTAFLASMSHEIRTPMNHILGGLDLLLDPEITHEEKEEFHSIIKKSSNQLLKLIDDIIDVSQLDSGQLEIKKDTFSLQSFLNEIKEEATNLKNNDEVDFQINTSAHQQKFDYLHTDKVRLKQVLISLLSNAFKFTKKGTVELGYSEKSEDMLQFYVSDTGIGIPEDSKKLIFEQFRQVDYDNTREYEGTGLGLTIAKGVVHLLGGDIWVESEEGKGSTFYFTIKTQKPKPQATPSQPVVSSSTTSYDWTNKTILIVEDEEMNYQYLKTVLKKTQANVLWAKDGVEGVESAKENEVHMVLMDIQLPEMNGYEATRKILEIKPQIPIIAQTAHALKEEKTKCFEAGAVDYMAKPLNRKKLLDLIDKHII
ncbi:MAG: response regulator, partial [Bacteroidales bacterium]|nr:response regulator [Bacteroidales bacterium]